MTATTTEGTQASESQQMDSNPEAENTLSQPEAQQTTEAAESAPGEATPNEQSTAAESASDAYEFQAPEGKEFHPDTLKAFTDVVREQGLKQENAQKILDTMGPAIESSLKSQVEAQNAKWIAEIQADKELGGSKLADTLSTARRAIDRFGDGLGVKEWLDTSGAGNNPDFIRFMHRIGQQLSEEKAIGDSKQSGAAPQERESVASVQGQARAVRNFYSSSNPE